MRLSNQVNQPLSHYISSGNIVSKDYLRDHDVNHKTVVETGGDGMKWYRLWSDGWLEQGGIVEPSTNNTIVTITFLKPYKDTNYVLVGGPTPQAQTNSWSASHVSVGYNKTTTTFTIYLAGNNSNTRNQNNQWYTCGY